MPHPLQRLVVLLAALLAGACGSELTPVPATPDGLPYAFAVGDCAPWDGPAVSIYLTPTSTDGGAAMPWPNVRISIYQRAEDVPGALVAWPTDAEVGGASRCTGPDACVHATRGRVRFRARQPDGALAGFAELEFADGTALHGGFRAVLRPTRVTCG